MALGEVARPAAYGVRAGEGVGGGDQVHGGTAGEVGVPARSARGLDLGVQGPGGTDLAFQFGVEVGIAEVEAEVSVAVRGMLVVEERAVVIPPAARDQNIARAGRAVVGTGRWSRWSSGRPRTSVVVKAETISAGVSRVK